MTTEADNSQGAYMTEVMAAIAVLNNEEPPSATVIVPASVLSPISSRIEKEANPERGYQMADGSIYLGRFKGGNGIEKNWFVADKDIKSEGGKNLMLPFQEAARLARVSKAHGHDDWIVPPGSGDSDGRPDILGAMFNSKSTRAFEGTFSEDDSVSSGWYWSSSSSPEKDCAQIRSFNDGALSNMRCSHSLSDYGMSVRFVRGVAV